jgi:hypothetical protein
MAYKITYEHPDFPKGHEFDMTGVGIVENGKTKTLDKDAEIHFVAMTGQTVKDYFSESESVKVEGSTELKSAEVAERVEGGEV